MSDFWDQRFRWVTHTGSEVPKSDVIDFYSKRMLYGQSYCIVKVLPLMQYKFQKLKNVLINVVGDDKLLVIQPGGNYGDYLIYNGFNKIVSDIGIECVEFGDREFRHDGFGRLVPSINPTTNIIWLLNQLKYIKYRLNFNPSGIYIHGGGNFNDLWNIGVQCYRSASRFFDCPIIVGPQSCRFENTNVKKIFKSTKNDTYFFCREKYSYDLITNNTKDLDHVDTFVAHDTALYLDRSDLSLPEAADEYTLLAFRPDKESCDPVIKHTLAPPIKSQDISHSTSSLKDFIFAGEKADEIFTDRLHGAILGVILGKPVRFYDNAYHKNRGVYEYSLSDNSKVEFEYLRKET